MFGRGEYVKHVGIARDDDGTVAYAFVDGSYDTAGRYTACWTTDALCISVY